MTRIIHVEIYRQTNELTNTRTQLRKLLQLKQQLQQLRLQQH